MTLKELLEVDFEVNLPISGGLGNAIDSPIIIHKREVSDYVGIEHLILKCLGTGRDIKWKILTQSLMEHNNRKIDKIRIETIDDTKVDIITQIEAYYFDITEFISDEDDEEEKFDEKVVLTKIKNRLIELEQINDFNKKCIGLLRSNKLFEDDKLIMEFLDILFEDESLPLFESMMKFKKKSMLLVLNVLALELGDS